MVAIPASIVVLCISVIIHVPFLKSSGTHQQSPAPAAIAHEAPEGTYLFPVTEQSQEQPPTVNLVLNLRLVMDAGNNKTNKTFFYDIDTSVLLENTPLVKFIRKYI